MDDDFLLENEDFPPECFENANDDLLEFEEDSLVVFIR